MRETALDRDIDSSDILWRRVELSVAVDLLEEHIDERFSGNVTALARHLGVTSSYLSRVLRGVSVPNDDLLNLIKLKKKRITVIYEPETEVNYDYGIMEY